MTNSKINLETLNINELCEEVDKYNSKEFSKRLEEANIDFGNLKESLSIISKAEEDFRCKGADQEITKERILRHLVRVKEETQKLTKELAVKTRFATFEHGSELRKNIKNTEYIIEPFIPKKGFVCIGGETGHFKTFSCIQLGLALASGTEYLGYKVKEKQNVLYIDEENNCSIIKERHEAFEKGHELGKVENFIPMSSQGFHFDNEEDFEALEELIKTKKINVVIIDSLPMTTDYNENSSSGISKLYGRKLKLLMERYNLTWILIQHFTKGAVKSLKPEALLKLFRGSVALTFLIDIAIVYHKTTVSSLDFIPCKVRSGELPRPRIVNIELKSIEDGKGNNVLDSVKFSDIGESNIEKSAYEKCGLDILDYYQAENLKEFSTSKSDTENIFRRIEKAFGYSQDVVYKSMKQLINKGKIAKSKDGKGKIIQSKYLIIRG